MIKLVKCVVERCKNQVRLTGVIVHRWGKNPPCANCRHVFHYWERKLEADPMAAVNRQRTLMKWQDRMLYLADEAPSPKRNRLLNGVKKEIKAQARDVRV